MNVLIVFATYSNGTAIAAQTVADVFTKAGHTVTTKQVRDTDPSEFIPYDLIVMASPSWLVNNKEGQPHDDYFRFRERCGNGVFRGKQFAILGLGDSTFAHFCGAADYLEGWVTELQGTIKEPSLRIDAFYFDQAKNTGLITDWATKLAENPPAA